MRFPYAPAGRYQAVLAWALLAVRVACGQVSQEIKADLIDRPVSEIRIEGLHRVSEQLVRNQLRSAVGDPYDPATVRDDVALLYRLGEFRTVTGEAELSRDGTVVIIYRVVEAAMIAEVQVVGNKLISDQDLLAAAGIARGVPIDDFLIEKAKRSIEALYRARGHYLTSVTVDESELDKTGILFFRVIEGPRVKVKAIEFEGNAAFTASELRNEIKTQTAFPFFRRGELDEEQLTDDVATISRFYADHGFLDVRVDRLIDLSPDSTEAKVTFLIIEGRRFTLRSIQTEPDPLGVFSQEQIEALVVIRPGDIYLRDKIRRSQAIVQDAYGLMGYLDVRIDATELRSGDAPEVDLLLEIDEGQRSMVGLVEITGNFLTLDRIIRRELRGLQPGRPFDAREIERSAERIRATRLFTDVNITLRDPDPARPEYRDVLVEVKEANTGSVNFGVAAGSDTGFFGEFSLVQRNFDITDLPESMGELFSGRAFRGAGQRFSMVFRPGNELFQYVVSFVEPNLFDSQYSLALDASWRERQYDSSGDLYYNEERLTFAARVGRKLGDVWEGGVDVQFDRIKLTDIAPNAPVDVFEAAGPDNIWGFGFNLSRSTVTTLTRPGNGSRFTFAADQFFGDFTFSRAAADYTVFVTITRDFQDRRSILKLSGRVGYIFGGDAPLYERFYLGGRTLRGFDFRTVSPKGINLAGNQTSDPVGGDWMIFLGAQYEIPLIGELLTGVVFVDSGTVTNTPGFSEYRVSVGAGVRIYIRQFGPVPIAFDFGFPIAKQPLDEEQVMSFSAELPF